MDTSGFFETFFKNARYNGILIMNKQGIILNVNEGFRLRFGYTHEDLTGKNFAILFIEKDREILKPERELSETITNGSGNDENYLIHKSGHKVWVTGESVLIENKEGDAFIVKVVHNIHAQKQLERFLIESHEFIDTVFDSIDESALLMLDSRLRIVKANKAFQEMFELEKHVAEGSRLTEINNAFWKRPDVKQEAVSYLTMNNKNGEKTFELNTKSGAIRKVIFRAKLVEGIADTERKLLIMIKFAL